MMYPEAHLDMVRAGNILYGLYPSEEVDKSRLPLKKVMTLKSRITMVKELSDVLLSIAECREMLDAAQYSLDFLQKGLGR